MKKKEFSAVEKERQQKAIDRLSGGKRNSSKGENTNSRTKIVNTKDRAVMGKKDNPKDILNRMK